MADNDNTITLVGRIGQEPELRSTPKGDVLNFTLATSERRRNADGSWSDGPTSWFRVAAWNDLGLHAHASLHRGQQVVVRGVLTVSEFQLESGARTRTAEVKAIALGHDLRWGTTTFVDAGRRSVESGTTVAPAAPAAQAASTAEAPRETVPSAPEPGWGSGFVEDAPF